jgi:hypothetical protein
MKLEASSRHSDGYFFEVNSVFLRLRGHSNSYKYKLTHHHWNTASSKLKYTNHVQQLKLDTYPIKQKLSRKPRSSVTNYKVYNSTINHVSKGNL